MTLIATSRIAEAIVDDTMKKDDVVNEYVDRV